MTDPAMAPGHSPQCPCLMFTPLTPRELGDLDARLRAAGPAVGLAITLALVDGEDRTDPRVQQQVAAVRNGIHLGLHLAERYEREALAAVEAMDNEMPDGGRLQFEGAKALAAAIAAVLP